MSISMTRVVASRSASNEGKEEEGTTAAAAAAQAGFRASVTCGREGMKIVWFSLPAFFSRA